MLKFLRTARNATPYTITARIDIFMRALNSIDLIRLSTRFLKAPGIFVLGKVSSELPRNCIHQQLNLFPADNLRTHLTQRLPPIFHRPFKQPILRHQSTDHSAMLTMNPLAIQHQPVLHSASSASKQTSPREIIVYMHHPESLRRSNFKDQTTQLRSTSSKSVFTAL